MTFAKPEFLFVLIILLPVMALFFFWFRGRQQAAIKRLGNPELIKRLSAGVNWRGRRWMTGLWFAALALVLVALARPQWGIEEETFEQKGVQVMVALDVSQSMLAEDIKPNRLSRAKLEIADLMTRLGGDEVGLVLFSGASFIQFPLTSDYGTARTFLDNARPGVISKPGTAIGDAIRTALTGFDEKRPSQKVLLIITDGEDHEADTMAMVQQAVDQGVKIYTIGFGSPEGEPIPEFDGSGQVIGFKKDRNGEVVMSKLDETTLQEIARIGGGQYFRASAGGLELDALVTELNQLQKAEIGTRTETRGIERFQIFLALALLALIAMELIPDSVRVREAKSRPVMGSRQAAFTSLTESTQRS